MRTPLFAIAAAALLVGCNSQPSQPQVLDSNPDPMANTLASAPKVELPPAIKAEKTLRCKDNSLLYVTFYQGDKQAAVSTEQTGARTRLTAPEAGQPLTAEGGWSMTGTTENVSITIPGKGDKVCHS